MQRRRSIFHRLTLAATIIAALMVLALWALAHLTIARTLDHGLARAVDTDLAGLVDIYQSGGRDELVARISDREALSAQGGGTRYLLVASDGARLAGNFARWPGFDARLSQAGWVDWPGGGHGWARATMLAGDTRLLIVHEAGERAEVLRAIAVVFGIGGMVLVTTVAVLGGRASRKLARRIERLNAAFRQPDRIDPAMIGTTDRDEIDELAQHSAAGLARLRLLAEAHRETSDQIAHEIRTPLMHLDTRLQRAFDQAGDGEVRQRLAGAREEIKRLVSMLESLLDISSSKARAGDPEGLQQVDLSALVVRICELFIDSAEDEGLELRYRVEPGIIVAGEEMRLARLITNLLDNAIKYVPAGGHIGVALEPGPRLVVEDDGPGIPDGEREAIFRRFVRGERDERSTDGSGLGLALAAAIAQRHGFRLGLQDRDGPGARFVMEKP